jgi:hypothetical protein
VIWEFLAMEYHNSTKFHPLRVSEPVEYHQEGVAMIELNVIFVSNEILLKK